MKHESNLTIKTFQSINDNEQRSAILSECMGKLNEKDAIGVLKELKTANSDLLTSSVNFKNNDGSNFLLKALVSKKFKLAIWLLENLDNIDVNAQNYTRLDSATILACKNKQRDILDLLIEKRADLELTNNEGKNAFIYAVQKGPLEIVELLIDKVEDIDLQDAYGNTALMYTCKLGKTRTAKLLLNKFADPNIKNIKGETALIFARDYVSMNGRSTIVELLLLFGAKSNIQNDDQKKALNHTDDQKKALNHTMKHCAPNDIKESSNKPKILTNNNIDDLDKLGNIGTYQQSFFIPRVKNNFKYRYSINNLNQEMDISIHKKQASIYDGYLPNQKKHKANAILDEKKHFDIFIEENESDFGQNEHELQANAILDEKKHFDIFIENNESDFDQNEHELKLSEIPSIEQ